MQSELTFDFEEKCKILKNIRNDIKKKRILLDESKDYFGLDEMSLLTKVKNTSEIKGYPFKASKKGKSLRGIKMGLKVVPIETKYKKDQHPSNSDIIIVECDLIHPSTSSRFKFKNLSALHLFDTF